jgi:SAM-dependent methyltransferase
MEAALYERMWSHQDYRRSAPGEHLAYTFIEKCKPYGKVIDFGCGTGRGASIIKELTGAEVLALDFAGNCLDEGVNVEFRQHDLRKPVGETAEFGFCTDVLEHIAPEDVDVVLVNILTASKRAFLSISTVPDHFGPVLAGEPLHLTVQPHAWWKAKLEALGARIDWEHEGEDSATFYCSIYANGDDYAAVTGLNVTEERIKENIAANLKLGLAEVCPHEAQDTKIYVLAGGPSLADHEDEIIKLGKEGALFVTVNGTYKWLIDRGIRPAAQFMVDAREFNARFVDPIIPTCKYIFSSQSAQEAVAKVPKEQAMLYHSGDSATVKECFDAHCKEVGQDRAWYPIYGGSTVIGRSLVTLAMLGFRNIEIFGWDSCLRGDQHHAYSQPENDSTYVANIEVGGKTFRCHPWMVVQANEFPKIIRYILGPIDGLNLNVRGDGLIAHMLKHSADLAQKIH